MLRFVRTSFSLSLFIAVLILQNAIYAQINEGLVAYWQFENDEGTNVIKDYIGDANGTIVNSTGVAYVPGVVGKALSFAQADSNAIGWVDYNEVFDFAFDNFTISLWVTADPLTERGEMMVFKKGSSLTGDDPVPNGNGRWYAISFYGGGTESNPQIFYGIDDDLVKTEIAQPIPDYIPHEWMNIVAIRNVDEEYISLYLDGELVASKSDLTDDISGIDLPIQIMNYGLAGSKHNKVNGAIDELKIYNRVLSDEEISGEYERIATAVNQTENYLNKSFSISQNYPNPFNPVTTINFSIDKQSYVSLKVYNVQGQEVEVLVNDELYAVGTYTVKWSGQGLPGGVYFYRLEANGKVRTRKMILQK